MTAQAGLSCVSAGSGYPAYQVCGSGAQTGSQSRRVLLDS
ncbi:hypothetical protein SEA_ZUKO_102 [Streptomyces phage Zuko]|uniref:Uncharacterized protein n=1 Tax=Streptomyces phage Zuko TaxID=2601695 RepID=A0A5J6D765_9CAUD|nr:hypothetical protein PP630_gp102 [Streptomyces phage Zuko]QEQ93680.1 hypothetical protein SEA_ZUKO_102 [Streptomyces phage Zuko]